MAGPKVSIIKRFRCIHSMATARVIETACRSTYMQSQSQTLSLAPKTKNWRNAGGGGSGQVGTEKFVFRGISEA